MANGINWRKRLAVDSFKTFKNILDSNKNSIQIILTTANTDVTSVFLYITDLWILTKRLEKAVDVFHSRLLWYILKANWPEKIMNAELYNTINQEHWHVIMKRYWLGHLLRLHENTLTSRSFAEGLTKTEKPIGTPHPTWFYLIKVDLQDVNSKLNYNNLEVVLDQLIEVERDRNERWKQHWQDKIWFQ